MNQYFEKYKPVFDKCIEYIKPEKDPIKMFDNMELYSLYNSLGDFRGKHGLDLRYLSLNIKQIYNSKLTDLNSLIRWVESVSFSDYRCVNIQKRVYEFLLAAKDYMNNEVSKIANK